MTSTERAIANQKAAARRIARNTRAMVEQRRLERGL